MKKLLLVGAIILVAVLSVIGSIVAYVVSAGSGLDESSKAYVDANIPVIASQWSEEELLKRSSLQLLDLIKKNPTQLDQVFKKLATLGALKQYGASKGQAVLSFNVPNGKTVTAKYVADAKFEHGDANFQIQLVQTDGQWQIINFHVDSPIFLP